MNDRFTHDVAPGVALTLAPAAWPRRLVVTQGRLWLTLTGALGDHWLQAGDGWTLEPGQEAVLEGWPQASYQVLGPAPLRSRPRARRAWGGGGSRAVAVAA